MKKKILKRILKKEIKKLREQEESNSLSVSQNDPSNSCVGRNICCKNRETSNISPAEFILKQSNRVECKCPKGSIKTFCEN